MIFTTYIHFKIHGRRGRRWYEGYVKTCEENARKKRITVVELFTFKSFGHRCYDLLFISSVTHSYMHIIRHSLTQHSFYASPALPTAVLQLCSFLSLAPLARWSLQPEKSRGSCFSWPIMANCFKLLPPLNPLANSSSHDCTNGEEVVADDGMAPTWSLLLQRFCYPWFGP